MAAAADGGFCADLGTGGGLCLELGMGRGAAVLDARFEASNFSALDLLLLSMAVEEAPLLDFA